jgi:hypothetical protein
MRIPDSPLLLSAVQLLVLTTLASVEINWLRSGFFAALDHVHEMSEAQLARERDDKRAAAGSRRRVAAAASTAGAVRRPAVPVVAARRANAATAGPSSTGGADTGDDWAEPAGAKSGAGNAVWNDADNSYQYAGSADAGADMDDYSAAAPAAAAAAGGAGDYFDDGDDDGGGQPLWRFKH